MDTEVTLFVGDSLPESAAGPLLEAANRIFRLVEQHLSRFDPESELSRLNRTGRLEPASPLLRNVLREALRARRRSGGLFDPAILPALEAAGYDRPFALLNRGDRVEGAGQPGKAERKGGPGGASAGSEAVRLLPGGSVCLPPGVRLDFGGIAKGWAVDRAARVLAPAGEFLVDAGGDLRLRAGAASPPWNVDVDDPWEPGRVRARLQLAEGAVATSSVIRRRWGTGHHLIDPRTGRPAETDLAAVTAIAPTAVEAEVAAKVALLLGKAGADRWLRHHGYRAVAVKSTGEIAALGGIDS